MSSGERPTSAASSSTVNETRHRLREVEAEVLVGELARGDAVGDQVEVDPCILERLHETHAVHVLRGERAVLVVRDEDADADELLDPLDRAARELGDLRFRKPHPGSVSPSVVSGSTVRGDPRWRAGPLRRPSE